MDLRPIVLVTGVAGGIGTALATRLRARYRVVGLDLEGKQAAVECIPVDLTSDESMAQALDAFRKRHGPRIASVVHLAAYFDFTGAEHRLYQAVNIEGTRRLLRALQGFEVEQLVFSGTMLVHAPCEPGERITEDTPIAPRWAYPRSKAEAEQVIRVERGRIRSVRLRLAGVYDERTAVPTLAQQIKRIYERELESHLYPGDLRAGQSLVHREDMVDAVVRAVDRRDGLPDDVAILVGEPDPPSYAEIQERVGCLIHGERAWSTMRVPKLVAKVGALAEHALEAVVPDAIDRGEKPFVRPFMIELADDHYALDIGHARALLGWEPRHDFRTTLPKLVEALKRDPLAWYRANAITPPPWLEEADELVEHPETLRRSHEARYRAEHQRTLWAHFANAGLGTWLLASPAMFDYASRALAWSDALSGVAIIVLALASLSWRLGAARWACAGVGFWLLWAPLIFRAPAPEFLTDTLTGGLIIGFAVLLPPTPGISPVASRTGPTVPPGWDYSPSSWHQRLPTVVLAVVGFHISHHLVAYQLGHAGAVWDPFFAGGADPKNGSEEIVTSWVSEAWPVPDAGVGAVTYMLEILTGVIGSARRWRTMPWLSVLFGLMIVPLGVVSITFIIIQPILLGTWCTLCLIAAAAMIAQIPYSVDELIATGQFLLRRRRAGQNPLRIFFVGDTDEGRSEPEPREFEGRPFPIVREIVGGGITLPWTLALCLAIGAWLMLTRLTLGSEAGMANADHLIGALVLTFTGAALAESARAVRFVNIPFGAALLVTPFVYEADAIQTIASLACGMALIALSLPRGPIRNRYGDWDRYVV